MTHCMQKVKFSCSLQVLGIAKGRDGMKGGVDICLVRHSLKATDGTDTRALHMTQITPRRVVCTPFASKNEPF